MERIFEENPILTAAQKQALDEVSRHPIAEAYHLAGGTAIAAFYLRHRLSEDLDFFAAAPWPLPQLEAVVRGLPDVERHSLSVLYDRRVFFLHLEGGADLKIEFSKFDFPLLDPLRPLAGNLQVESLRDLLAGKLATLIDRFEPRDFADVYSILAKDPNPKERLAQGVKDLGSKFGLPNTSQLLQQAFGRSARIEAWPAMRIPFDPGQAKKAFLDWARILVRA